MKKAFNTKIFGVALLPFDAYVLISVYVFVHAGFRLDVFHFPSVVLLSCGLMLAAVLYAFRYRLLHRLALCIMVILGGIGIYVGLILDPVNWMELISSAFIIAFGIAFYELVEHLREESL